MNFSLNNLHIVQPNALDGSNPAGANSSIKIRGEKIECISNSTSNNLDLDHFIPTEDRFQYIHLDLTNCLAFPGLINSHDHLEFNLFPKLGNRIYNNYVEWGNDIHRQNKTIIDKVLSVPENLRVQWGMYKNLLNGVTTVVQHGKSLTINDPLITIYQNCRSLHSVRQEKYWKGKLNSPFASKKTFAIHIGEGTDKASFLEITKLLEWNLLKRELIAIHGVAMQKEQAEKFKALVWCPDSNFFLLNATADIRDLKQKTQLIFGTDSTLTAGWNLWEQLRMARNLRTLSDLELLESVTCTPASVWNLNNTGILREKMDADIVIATGNDKSDLLKSFYSLNPRDMILIMNKGSVVLFDEGLMGQLKKGLNLQTFSKIGIGGKSKYVKGDLPLLITKIKEKYDEVFLPVEFDQTY